MYNVGFAYSPAVTLEHNYGQSSGPIGANFQASSSLSNSELKSGQTITITFDSINASAPAEAPGQDGYLWIAYTPPTVGLPVLDQFRA